MNFKVGIEASFRYNASWNPIKVFNELKNADLELKIKTSFTAKGEFKASTEYKFALGTIGFRPVTGVYFDIQPEFKVTLSASVNATLTVSKNFGFKWSYANGSSDTSTPLEKKFDIKLQGEIFVGINLNPSIGLVCKKLISVNPEMEFGAVISATLPLVEKDLSGISKHLCAACISGDVKARFTFGVTIKILNKERFDLKNKINFTKEYPLCDYYYSSTFDEFGFTKCPHTGYYLETTVTLDGNPVSDAAIYLAKYEDTDNSKGSTGGRGGTLSEFKKIGKTDSNGKFTTYLEKGDYQISTENKKDTGHWIEIKGDKKKQVAFDQYTVTVNVQKNGKPVVDETVNYSDIGINYSKAGQTNSDGKLTLLLEKGKHYIKVGDETKDFEITDKPAEIIINLKSEEDPGNETKPKDTDTDKTTDTDKEHEPSEPASHEKETTALVASGNCGANVKWALYKSGTLYIYGSGKMKDYSYSSKPPYYTYGSNIVNSVIESGVTIAIQ